jgi:hypothetical protein
LVKAGRHKTSQVASVFNNECNPNQQSTFGHTAGELNFYIRGDLTITSSRDGRSYSLPGTCIAQGNNGSNNWWFAGDLCRTSWQQPDHVSCRSAAQATLGDPLIFWRGFPNPNDHIGVIGDHYATPNQSLDIFNTGSSLCVCNATSTVFSPLVVMQGPNQQDTLIGTVTQRRASCSIVSVPKPSPSRGDVES